MCHASPAHVVQITQLQATRSNGGPRRGESGYTTAQLATVIFSRYCVQRPSVRGHWLLAGWLAGWLAGCWLLAGAMRLVVTGDRFGWGGCGGYIWLSSSQAARSAGGIRIVVVGTIVRVGTRTRR